MKLTFLGTRGEIERRTPLHSRHSALLLDPDGRRIMVDCGADWLDELSAIHPSAIVVTHAHPDHANGLRNGAPCPVLATAASWERMKRFEVQERLVVEPRRSAELAGVRIEAFAVEHSLRAPAVGLRLETDAEAIFYAPDLVSIDDESEALARLDLYIGDGASLTRSIIRRRDEVRIGHSSIRRQLEWCATAGVPWAIFTHCGSQIVKGDPKEMSAAVEELGKDLGVLAQIAHDGLEISVGEPPP